MKAEFDSAELGDTRLDERLGEVIESMIKRPESSFAAMCESEAQREGLYRFLRNPRVDWEAVLKPHVSATVRRAQQAQQVLVVHDSTEMRVYDQADLNSYLQPKRKGFIAHMSLVLDAAQERCPLGIAQLQTLERKHPSKLKRPGRRMRSDETAKLEDKEYERWRRGVEKSSERLAELEEVIHVMDAEADSYALLASMQRAAQHFVVRLRFDRCAKALGPGAEPSHIRALLRQAKTFKRTREVHVSKRAARRAPEAAKRRPPRDARAAKLTLSFTTLVVKRPDYLSCARELRLQVVRVWEKSPPPGVDPIEWIVLTNLPVQTKTDAERIVDIYRQRWLVEELFKALKTGCAFRKRKLANRQSIYTSLALLAPIACVALMLRQAARSSTARASQALSPTQLHVLRAKAHSLGVALGPNPTAVQALSFLAQIGGHRKSNGPPGWETLMRGLQKLHDLEAGWSLRESHEM